MSVYRERDTTMRSIPRSLRRGGAATLLIMTTGLLACPGDLDPRFLDTGPQTGNACSSDDMQRLVFNASCTTAGCHDSSNQPSGGLDLLSPGAQQRLVNVSTPAGQVCATSRTPVLVVPGDPAHSLLLLKVEPSPPCGNRMPFGTATALTDRQIECIRSWIAALPPGTPFDSGVPPVDVPIVDAARDVSTDRVDVQSMDIAMTDSAMDSGVDVTATDIVVRDVAPDIAPDITDTGVDAAMDTGAPMDTGTAVDAAMDAGGGS